MIGLIIKDFRANWIYLVLALAVFFTLSLGFIIAIASGKPIEWEIYVLLVILSSFISPILFLIIDEMYQTEDVFASLPVTRTHMVFARYGTAILLILLALSVHLIAIFLGTFFAGEVSGIDFGLIFNPELWMGIFVLLLLFVSFFYPFYFKFGLVKGAIIFGIIQLSILVLGFIGIINSDFQVINSHFIQPITTWISNQQEFTLLMGLGGLLLFILSISVAVSSKVYQNKDI